MRPPIEFWIYVGGGLVIFALGAVLAWPALVDLGALLSIGLPWIVLPNMLYIFAKHRHQDKRRKRVDKTDLKL